MYLEDHAVCCVTPVPKLARVHSPSGVISLSRMLSDARGIAYNLLQTKSEG